MKGMTKLQANLCLLCVTLCWSTEVIIFACIPKTVPAAATNCITSAIGAAILAASFFRRIRTNLKQGGRRLILACLTMSILNGAYNTMYIYGLKHFDVSTGAFTLSMTVVVLPVILLTLRQKVTLHTWLSAALVLAGILLSIFGKVHIGQTKGLMLMIGGCMVRAVYIVLVNKYAKEYDPLTMSALITAMSAMLNFGLWFADDPHTFASLELSRPAIASLFIHAYFIVAFAQTINFFAQRRTTAASATVIYSLEIVFSILWGVILPPSIIEPAELTLRTVIGVLFVVAGSLIELIDFRSLIKKGVAVNEE